MKAWLRERAFNLMDIYLDLFSCVHLVIHAINRPIVGRRVWGPAMGAPQLNVVPTVFGWALKIGNTVPVDVSPRI